MSLVRRIIRDDFHRRWNSRVLRCVLILAAWQGPVPWIHKHGTLANASPYASTWLAEHLRTLHPGLPSSADLNFGWHVHFAYPKPNEQGKSIFDHERLAQSFFRDELVRSAAMTRLFRPDLLIAASSNHLACSRPDSAGHFRCAAYFHEHFAPSLALPMRLGVARY